MYNLKSAGAASVAVLLFFNLSDARAQVYGTDYLSFEGSLYILDNPTSAVCQSRGFNYGQEFIAIYRYTANPSLIADALAINSAYSVNRIISTQSPNFSLAGPSTGNWIWMNGHGRYGTLGNSGSNLTILSGLNQPVTLATGNIKILGSINDFIGNSGCNINSVHGALVARPF
jgi:hypothetical protein